MYAIQRVAYLADQRFHKLVKSMTRRVPNIADAEDIVQTAFERAIKYADSFKGEEEEFTRWFHSILTNSWKDWRKAERHKGMTTEVDEKNGGMVACAGEDKELARIVAGEIRNMKASFKKDVIYRRFCMGLAVNEIAELMEVDRERVKKSILRWRQDIYAKYGVNL